MHREEPAKKRGSPRRGERRGPGPLGPARPPSDRPAQVATEIRRALQTELSRGLNDPRVQGLVSVTEVELSPDLSNARVRVSVMPEDRSALTLSGLRAGAGFLRRRVMDETRLSRVPRLEFELDDRIKRQAALDAVIRTPESADPRAAGGASAPSATPDPRRDGGAGGQHPENPIDEA